jgi:ABC-type dipeptide/oligopeptide/nickel transport system ATPase component
MSTHLLDLRLTVDYRNKPGVLRDVAIHIDCGEVLGLIGESGSGKSTLALSIMRLLEGKPAGHISFNGRDLLRLKNSEMRDIRGREISMVLQSPIASLNPALRIGTQMAEAWRAHERSKGGGWRDRVIESFEMVALPGGDELLDRYPRQLSVGQAQRVLIAMAILHRPQLLIADEPTSALDAITSAEVLALFKRLSRELNMAILFISHDLLSVASLCDRLAILKRGEIVESGPTGGLFHNPVHEYTRALLRALPQHPLHEVGNDLLALSEFARPRLEPEVIHTAELQSDRSARP